MWCLGFGGFQFYEGHWRTWSLACWAGMRGGVLLVSLLFVAFCFVLPLFFSVLDFGLRHLYYGQWELFLSLWSIAACEWRSGVRSFGQ